MKYLVAFVFILAVHQAVALRKRYAGRPHGRGLLPPPIPPNSPKSAVSAAPAYKIEKFTQLLDHFNKSETRTWTQYYQVNDDEYKQGGPIFVMISGEGPLDGGWLYYGQMYENGKRQNALMFQLEHRFYGNSHPTEDVSVDNLRYLSSHQALADLDNFIHSMKEQYKIPDAKVAVFGGSYSGNLVVWYRELYPNSSVAAVASSAPVLAEVDFIEYVVTVGQSMKYFDPKCYDAVSDAMTEVRKLVADKNSAELERLFGLCKDSLDFSDPYQIQTFYDTLSEEWMGITQYNGIGKNSNLYMSCVVMTNATIGTPLERYSYWFGVVTGDQECFGVDYQGEIDDLRNSSWSGEAVMGGSRQWLWQTCTEFAYYQSMDSKDQPFGYQVVDLEYLEDIFCVQPFGISSKEIADSVDSTNQKYGGKKPNATRVFLMNGSIDPWHPLGIFENDLNSDAPHRFIIGTSHCYDMHGAQPDDPADLIKAREDAADQLSKWLGQKTGSASGKSLSVLSLIVGFVVAVIRL